MCFASAQVLPSLVLRTATSHFFFNDTATTEIYTLSLHDALPTSAHSPRCCATRRCRWCCTAVRRTSRSSRRSRSEEHTSELQSPCNLVCRLLLEKKKFLAEAPKILLHKS